MQEFKVLDESPKISIQIQYNNIILKRMFEKEGFKLVEKRILNSLKRDLENINRMDFQKDANTQKN